VDQAGLRRFVVLFVIELSTRRVQIAGIAPQRDGLWMAQVGRNLIDTIHLAAYLESRGLVGLLQRSNVDPTVPSSSAKGLTEALLWLDPPVYNAPYLVYAVTVKSSGSLLICSRWKATVPSE
jgi:hypothetical protein